MQTNVNFLMWAAVTVLLVLTSLLLGLFWGGQEKAPGYPGLTTHASYRVFRFCLI